MRILHLIPQLMSGGAERQLSYLAPKLAEYGHEVHIAHLAGAPAPAELQKPSIFLHPLSHRSMYDPALFLGIIRLIRVLRPDLVQTWIRQMDILGGGAAFLTRTPWLLREPASAKFWLPSPKTALRVLTARTASMVVSNSVAGDQYWQAYKRDAQREVIVNAVPIESIDAVNPAVLDRALKADGRRLIVFAGRLDPQKNVVVLLRALIDIARRAPVSALLMGDGPLRSKLKGILSGSGVEQHIKLQSYSTQLWSIMKAADVAVSISTFEGRPNVVLEAMAARCLVVASDIPEHREILDDDSCYFVRNFEDPSSVAAVLLQSVSDADLARHKSDRARGMVASFTIDRLGQEYENVYRKIIKTGQRSDEPEPKRY